MTTVVKKIDRRREENAGGARNANDRHSVTHWPSRKKNTKVEDPTGRRHSDKKDSRVEAPSALSERQRLHWPGTCTRTSTAMSAGASVSDTPTLFGQGESEICFLGRFSTAFQRKWHAGLANILSKQDTNNTRHYDYVNFYFGDVWASHRLDDCCTDPTIATAVYMFKTSEPHLVNCVPVGPTYIGSHEYIRHAEVSTKTQNIELKWTFSAHHIGSDVVEADCVIFMLRSGGSVACIMKTYEVKLLILARAFDLGECTSAEYKIRTRIREHTAVLHAVTLSRWMSGVNTLFARSLCAEA